MNSDVCATPREERSSWQPGLPSFVKEGVRGWLLDAPVDPQAGLVSEHFAQLEKRLAMS